VEVSKGEVTGAEMAGGPLITDQVDEGLWFGKERGAVVEDAMGAVEHGGDAG